MRCSHFHSDIFLNENKKMSKHIAKEICLRRGYKSFLGEFFSVIVN